MSRRKINAKELVKDIQHGMIDEELMEKYHISPAALQNFFQQLVAAGWLEQAELDQRNEVFTCPSCEWSSHKEFKECPKCGTNIWEPHKKPLQTKSTAAASTQIGFSSAKTPAAETSTRQSQYKCCPHCGKLIPRQATHCQYCGETLLEEKRKKSPISTTQQFSINGALKFGWKTMKGHFWFFFVLLIILLLMNFVPDVIARTLGAFSPLSSVLVSIAAWVLYMIVRLGTFKIALKFCGDEEVAFSDLFSCASLFLKFLGGSILYGLICIAGGILFIIPGIIWGIKFQFFAYFIVDQGLGPISALKESSRITQGVKWDLFAFGFVAGIVNLLGALCLIIGLFATIPTTMVAYAFVYRSLEDPEYRATNQFGQIPSSRWMKIVAIILVGVFGIGVLSAIAVPNLLTAIQRSKTSRTKADMMAIGSALESFHDEHNCYPVQLFEAGLSQKILPEAYYNGQLEDAWQTRLRYVSDGKSYHLISYGKDKEAGMSGNSQFDTDIILSDGEFLFP